METEIISVLENLEWNKTIFRCREYDFYHCHSYNALEQSGDAFLFVVKDSNGDMIAFPLVLKSITGTEYFDCTSVYGYPGPVSNQAPERLSPELIRYFHAALSDYFREKKIIAAFTRLHPIIEQAPLLHNIGEVMLRKKTVAIDLKLPLEIQRQQYNSTNKRHLNRLRRNGYTVRKAETQAQIDEFVDVYNETMQRVNATHHYYFSHAYFHKFLSADDFSSFLLLAYQGDELAAGAIFTATNNIMQYHLSGTKATHLLLAPTKLLIDEARLLGTEMNLQYLHLGGGVGGDEEDSLLRFKSSFSNLTFEYKVWHMIVNEPIYQELVAARSKEKVLEPDSFPLYRG